MLARTNAALYSVESTEDTYSVNMAPIALESSAEVYKIATGNGVIVVLPEPGSENTSLSVSTDGSAYALISMDFVIYDIIYSEKMGKFIAVGGMDASPNPDRVVKTSVNGTEWVAEEWGDLGAGENLLYAYYSIRESGDGFYLVGGTYEVMWSAFVQFDNESNYSYTNVTSRNVGYNYECTGVIKGNERTVIVGKHILVQTGGVFASSEIEPDLFLDGYFIRFDGANIYKSLNAIDYSLVGATAYALNYICFYEGYYYGIAAGHVCRATSIAGLCSVDSTEYKEIENLTYSYVHAFEEHMLLCSGGFLFKTTIGGSSNPVTETIEKVSATDALNRANAYTDEQIAEVIARIEALESQ